MKWKIKQIAVGGFDDNFSYIVESGNSFAVIDPAGDAAKIIAAFPPGRVLQYYLLTHEHPDHADALPELQKHYTAPVKSGKDFTDNQRLPFGNSYLTVLFTPGHTPHSVCYLTADNSGLFTGDTLFVDYIGFGQVEKLYYSLQRLRSLPGHTIIYPGHNYGATPTSTIYEESIKNCYFKPQSLANFKENYQNLV